MFVLAVISTKGGSGKSTLSVCLASAAASAGYTAVIVDLDPQASASKWRDRRTGDNPNPAVVCTQASRLKPVLDVARANAADFVVIDGAGRMDDSALAAARCADMVLVPTRTSIFEVETMPTVIDVLRIAGVLDRSYAVLNGLHPSMGAAGITEAQRFIEQRYGLRSCPAYLCQRAAYSDTMLTGTTPQESDPDGKAGQELGRLLEFVTEQAKLRTGGLAKSRTINLVA